VVLSGPVGGTRRLLAKGRRLVTDPGALVADVAGLSSPRNRLVNDWATLSRMIVPARADSSPLRGEAGESKSLHWLTGVSATLVIAAAKGSGTTFNDVLLTGVAGGLRRYLAKHGDTDTKDLNFFIPVAMKPMDTDLPRELGNHFAVVTLSLPVGVEDVESRRRIVHERMSRVKHSDEALIVYGLQQVVAMGPERVGTGLTTSVADQAVGSITNVPGPRGPMTLGGARVAGVLGWNPTTSQQSLGVCIFSYDGGVTIGLSTDDMIITDPRSLLRCFHEEFAALELLEGGTDV
jgi:WS/DGAT/MGAT family acyltransferase